MTISFAILLLTFFFIALAYSSVGFGGGSSYLAILAVMQVDFELIRPTALLCNIIVVTGGCYLFYKEGKYNPRKVWPYLVISIPLAYLGGSFPIRERPFFIILGATLLVAAVLLWLQKSIQQQKGIGRPLSGQPAFNMIAGGAVGFLSGLAGIGGGIFLSPLLHLANWDETKRISALASLYILVNSISGLAGQLSQSSSVDWHFVWPLLLAVAAGGQLGSRLGIRKFDPIYIRRITAVLVFAAAINILNNNI